MISKHLAHITSALVASAACVAGGPAFASCGNLPDYSQLTQALDGVVDDTNAGLSNEMWATIVDRDGRVCAVTFSGDNRSAQWPGSRVISAQKANTGNAFSLDVDDGSGIALSSGNLYGTVLEQGSLFGLQFSNPVDPAVAYGSPTGSASRYGQSNDPLVGEFIGGINVFGGGLALYNAQQQVVGGLGVSGDTSCTDHVVAWRVRDALGLDFVPGGVGPDGTDNLNIVAEVTPGQFQHPSCGDDVADIIADLTADFPIGDWPPLRALREGRPRPHDRRHPNSSAAPAQER